MALPDGDGFLFFEELKADRASSPISVIFISARSDTSAKVRALKLGGDDYLTKPFDALELGARVESVLEIYQESPHGIAYATGGDRWNWEAEAGTLTVEDFPAVTCAICHMSGFGTAGTTHDVGARLTWYLFAPISQRARPGRTT